MWSNRFPLKGTDLALLAACAAGPVKGAEIRSESYATTKRRLSLLTQLGLLRTRESGRSLLYEANRPELSGAAGQAITERPDLTELQESQLRVLACLPDDAPSVPAMALSGLERKTWTKAKDQLAAKNLVLDSRGFPLSNPNLPGLQFFLQEYRRLFEAVPDGVATGKTIPPGPGDNGLRVELSIMAYVPIHQRGLETAWSISEGSLGPDAVPIGPSSNQEPYKAIVTTAQLAYYGPRRLDRWDHAFLYCASQRRYETDPTAPRGRSLGSTINARAKGLVLSMMNSELAFDELFADRAKFYGVHSIIADARQVYQDPNHAFWETIREMRNGFGIEEGYLADQS